MSTMENFLSEAWAVTLSLAPWLLVGTFVSGVVHVLLPKGFVHRQLRGMGGVFKAVGLGVPLPLCSCGVIPAGLGLKKDGASDGASVGFLISTPQTGVDSILVSASFLGLPFAVFKLLSAAVTGLVGGAIVEGLERGQPKVAAPEASGPSDERPKAREMLTHSDELLSTLWRWLVVGVVVSAAISTWVPESAFAKVGAWGTLGASLVVLVVSVPMYVCATASVPIAAALVAGGLPAGAALVFLMAGPATNVATIGSVYRAFGGRTLAVYLLTIILGSVGAGWAFDYVLTAAPVGAHAHGDHSSWWEVSSAVVFGILMVRYAAIDLIRWVGSRGSAPADGGTIEVAVSGMTCNGCVNKLEGALRKAEGVTMAQVTLEPGLAVVSGDIDPEGLSALIVDAGFEPGQVTAR